MALAIVAAPLANKPRQGGAAWVPLSWALGLRRLGFEVWLVEEIDAMTLRDENGQPVPAARSDNLAFFSAVANQFELPAALVVDAEEVHGAVWADLLELAGEADLLLNVSGHLSSPLLERCRLRVFLDLDPGFTQFWAHQGLGGARLAGHDAHYTVGENIGRPGCSIPEVGIAWRHTRNPVVLDLWPVAPVREEAVSSVRFTSVATWRGPYGPVEAEDRTLGLRVHEFRKFLALPAHAPGAWELALDIDPADDSDRRRLVTGGWRLVDPREVAGDPDSFREYVQRSDAEFGVAQGMYVETRSGWFSDRTVRYLASGRPALVQDTGFGENLPVGHGLIPFRTLSEASAGAAEIARDYPAHAAAARELAEGSFASDLVITRMLEELGLSS
jgi:hypothetical protein